MTVGQPLLRVENLVKHFPIAKGLFGRDKAVVHAGSGCESGNPAAG